MKITPQKMEILDIIRLAHTKGGSDVHFIPKDDAIEVRFRKHGVLSVLRQVANERKKSFAEDLKALLGFDMSVLNWPQDSRFAHPNHPVDVRASLRPTLHGEKIVLRLLNRDSEFDLDKYPMPDMARRHLKAALKKSRGVIVFGGATGGGKSTLSMNALHEIDHTTRSVDTIEDPIEYVVSRFSQSQVNHAKGLSYAQYCRSLMRQDPDVINIQETRDHETADAVVYAGISGHLTLTTVHADSAFGVIEKFKSFGVSEHLIREAVLFASYQALAKTLCSECSYVDDKDLTGLEAVLGVTLEGVKPMKADGCSQCVNGVGGRKLVIEFLTQQKNEDGKIELVQKSRVVDQLIDMLKNGEIDANEAYALAAR